MIHNQYHNGRKKNNKSSSNLHSNRVAFFPHTKDSKKIKRKRRAAGRNMNKLGELNEQTSLHLTFQ